MQINYRGRSMFDLLIANNKLYSRSLKEMAGNT